ncbi:MAG: hypothetical protein ACK559_09725, partial [bacterium]
PVLVEHGLQLRSCGRGERLPHVVVAVALEHAVVQKVGADLQTLEHGGRVGEGGKGRQQGGKVGDAAVVTVRLGSNVLVDRKQRVRFGRPHCLS